MSGITGLVDTALATRLSQRLDLLGLKPALEVREPGPPVAVEKVVNEVRLPSRAGLERELAAGPRGTAFPVAVPSGGAQLSAAARAIGAVLTDPRAEGGPVRGTAPLWPARQAPAAGALAATLAHTVAASGLFYESHLLEFALGQRGVGQLAQEPHARWGPARASGTEARPSLPNDVPAPAGQKSAPDAPSPALTPPERAYRWAALASAAAGASALAPAWFDRAGAADPVAAAAPAAAAALPGPPLAEMIHPQAMALVHQQLDLLATAVFRWTGLAWPGVPMEWTVQQEEPPADREAGALAEAPPRRWTTTLSLALPRLGTVHVRLSLDGPAVQAALVAVEPATLARLREGGGALSQRLESAGLRLDELQVAPGTAP